MSTTVPTTTTSSIAPATIPINVMVHSSRLSPDDRHDPILRGGGVGGNRACRCPIGMWAPGRAYRPARLLTPLVAGVPHRAHRGAGAPARAPGRDGAPRRRAPAVRP